MTGIQDAIISHIATHAAVPVIQADQGGEIPEGPHVVFKFTTPYTKGIGRPEIRTESDATEFRRIQSETYNVTLSITAVTAWPDEDGAVALAQTVRDWFDFYGYDVLSASDIVVSDLTDVGDRDSVNDDESRRGFDAILRVSRELVQVANWIEKAEVSQLQGG